MFFNHTATTEIYTALNTLSLHDALPILKVANDFKIKNDELVVEIVRLLEANKKFDKDVKSLEDSLAHLTKSHDQLQAQLLKELPQDSQSCPHNYVRGEDFHFHELPNFQ